MKDKKRAGLRCQNIKLTIIILVVLLIVAPSINAEPPFQESSSSVGLDIRYPQTDAIKQNTSVTYNVHVFNKSTGLIATNISTSCHIHLFNSIGDHVLDSDLEFDNLDGDFKINIDGGNFSEVQRMSAIVKCNSSTEGGFVSFGFEVTPNGKELPSGIVIVIFSAFFLGLLFFAIFSLLKMIGLWIDLNIDILDVALIFGTYFVIFAFHYLAKYYLGNVVVNDITLLMIQIGAITHIFVPLAAFITSMIFNPLRKKNG